MWGRKDEPTPTPAPAPRSQEPAPARPVARPPTPPVSSAGSSGGRGQASIGKSLKIKGTITGTEDLFIDGQIEGTIRLEHNSLTIGPNGHVDADVFAKDIVIEGKVTGNVKAGDRIDIRKTGSLNGDLSAARIVIEDGAVFRGSVDIVKPEPTPTPKAIVSTPAAAKPPVAEKPPEAKAATAGTPAKN
ncbi:MAG: polymer-forming cytoskeletal protein [Acidobacteria bacterium]|nr:polymer-forming cytoskeletal protein [Acidobacteriota bacterium]MDA1235090.1 polymer-forming cytoskeletal protein [Acidobacteriota bacterium]